MARRKRFLNKTLVDQLRGSQHVDARYQESDPASHSAHSSHVLSRPIESPQNYDTLGEVSHFSQSTSSKELELESDTNVPGSNAKFDTWVDSEVLTPLHEWFPDAEYQLTEVPFEQWPGPKRPPKPAKVEQEYQTSVEESQLATLRATGGKSQKLLVPRSMLLQTIMIDTATNTVITPKAIVDLDRYADLPDKKAPKPEVIGVDLIVNENPRNKEMVDENAQDGINLTWTEYVSNEQIALMQDNALNLHNDYPQDEFQRWALGPAVSDYSSDPDRAGPGVSNDMSSRGFAGFEKKVYKDELMSHPIFLPAPESDIERSDREEAEHARKKSDQLIRHGLIVRDWQHSEGNTLFPVAVNEAGKALMKYGRASEVARTALLQFMADPYFEWDAEHDPLIWVCTGVGRKGGLRDLQISIVQQSGAPARRVTLLHIIELCDNPRPPPIIKRAVPAQTSLTPPERSSKRIKTVPDHSSSTELVKYGGKATQDQIEQSHPVVEESESPGTYSSIRHSIDCSSDTSISTASAQEATSTSAFDRQAITHDLDFPLVSTVPDRLRSPAQIRMAQMLSAFVTRERNHQTLVKKSNPLLWNSTV